MDSRLGGEDAYRAERRELSHGRLERRRAS
jgi:hypothetical protein